MAVALLFRTGARLAIGVARNPIAGAHAQNPDRLTTRKAPGVAAEDRRVTTTVVVHGEVKDNYLPDAVTVGTLDGTTAEETPLSISTVVTRELLTDQLARLLSDVVKNDASVGEDYAPVGYYGDYEIRGFPIDLATGLRDQRHDHRRRAGCASRKQGARGDSQGHRRRGERRGLGGRADRLRDQAAGGRSRPSIWPPIIVAATYGAVDLGRLFGKQKQVGARVNLAGERIASYVNDANGWRAMGAGSADWKISPKAILKGDFEYQHKVERSVCGYQLLGGTTVPDIDPVYPSTMLGEQSWAKPNTFDTLNTRRAAGLRFAARIGARSRRRVTATR